MPSASVVCSICYGQSCQWKPVSLEIVPPTWLKCSIPYNIQNEPKHCVWIHALISTQYHEKCILCIINSGIKCFVIVCCRTYMTAWIKTWINFTVSAGHDQLQLLLHQASIESQSGLLKILVQLAHLWNYNTTSNICNTHWQCICFSCQEIVAQNIMHNKLCLTSYSWSLVYNHRLRHLPLTLRVKRKLVMYHLCVLDITTG